MHTKLFVLTLISSVLFSITGFTTSNDTLKSIEKKHKKFLKKSNYVLIPAGRVSTSNYYEAASRMPTPEVPVIQSTEIASFIMQKGEVTNKEYLDFLIYFKTKDPTYYQKIFPDTLVWRTPIAYNEPYVEHYLRHPSYQDYPVVGVSHQQAKMYCQWLTEKYNKNPDRIFKKVIYRLPTEAEWIYAAKGGNGHATFPWNGSYMRAGNGDLMANSNQLGIEGIYRDTLYEKDPNGNFKEIYIYRAGPHNYMGAAGALNDAADITAPSISYWPNAFGLYNMAGNVCEMVAEQGITHGGSWKDPGHYLQNQVRQFYEGEESASSKRGFRYVIEVVEY